ncbi:hypothetical protein LC613_18550 [Nostoc sphaeroides CHAB 2801]|uniref:hypothetical protein n=1 Tax=Nostoc sphaeroides TaxID=446679 RepID=UPI001E3CEED8|nr:hypothetical protein [Nostoc sphaeroides]MCC5629930.1 hypothetical protein [Nostoc sphaeroides CHAB 2801]
MVDEFFRKAKDLLLGNNGDQAEDAEYRDIAMSVQPAKIPTATPQIRHLTAT